MSARSVEFLVKMRKTQDRAEHDREKAYIDAKLYMDKTKDTNGAELKYVETLTTINTRENVFVSRFLELALKFRKLEVGHELTALDIRQMSDEANIAIEKNCGLPMK